MSIPNRLEKLRFLIGEMQLALLLARHAPDDFVARALARHVLVRAENYIEHARRLRTALNAARFATRDFHTRKEIYATTFEEYFKTARHKLSAHVQDLDFGNRIELWNDVEISKIGYFVDGAKEIYESLAALGIPGYVAHAPPTELTDPALLTILSSYQESADGRIRAEIGTDPLAMTRPSTLAVMVTGDAQQRAGQLVLIRRWIRSQRELAGRVYSVEIIDELAQRAMQRLKRQGYTIEVRVGNGYSGWPEHVPFDKLIVTAAPDLIPPPLINQLKAGGRMVIPVGLPNAQQLVVGEKDLNGRVTTKEIMRVLFSLLEGSDQAAFRAS